MVVIFQLVSSSQEYCTNRKIIEEIKYNNNNSNINRNQNELNSTNFLLLLLLQPHSSSRNIRYCVPDDNEMLALTHNIKELFMILS